VIVKKDTDVTGQSFTVTLITATGRWRPWRPRPGRDPLRVPGGPGGAGDQPGSPGQKFTASRCAWNGAARSFFYIISHSAFIGGGHFSLTAATILDIPTHYSCLVWLACRCNKHRDLGLDGGTS